MKRIILTVLVLLVVVSAFSVKIFAEKPDFQTVTVTNPVTGEPKKTVSLPPQAVEVMPDVFYLGTATDKDGRMVEGYVYIHHDIKSVNSAKPSRGADSCYSFLSRGAKWKNVEPWKFNPGNASGLNNNTLYDNLAADISKWEIAAGAKDILGNGTSTSETLDADTLSPDGVNEVYFSGIDSPGAIAITIVWGVFGGPAQGRELVEWDQVYDDIDFSWSLTGAADKMDFDNIATHELGHSVGLADLYQSTCTEQTMFGYASNGETKKQTLEAGDITGVKALYQ